MLGLPDEEDTLEQALEDEMELALDELDNFPKVAWLLKKGLLDLTTLAFLV